MYRSSNLTVVANFTGQPVALPALGGDVLVRTEPGGVSAGSEPGRAGTGAALGGADADPGARNCSVPGLAWSPGPSLAPALGRRPGQRGRRAVR